MLTRCSRVLRPLKFLSKQLTICRERVSAGRCLQTQPEGAPRASLRPWMGDLPVLKELGARHGPGTAVTSDPLLNYLRRME